MLTIRFLNNGILSKNFNSTIDNIYSFVSDKLNFNNTKTIRDVNSFEISSGQEHFSGENKVIVELIIRKNLIIHPDEFEDKAALDRHITKIKHFCEQAKEIEDLKYIPINMR